MILPGDLYLCLNEINTDFRSKIINAGFLESIFENQDIDKYDFCIVDAESENFEADNYKSADIYALAAHLGMSEKSSTRIRVQECWPSKMKLLVCISYMISYLFLSLVCSRMLI